MCFENFPHKYKKDDNLPVSFLSSLTLLYAAFDLFHSILSMLF